VKESTSLCEHIISGRSLDGRGGRASAVLHKEASLKLSPEDEEDWWLKPGQCCREILMIPFENTLGSNNGPSSCARGMEKRLRWLEQ
jgi:hypothetical protein